MAFPSSGHRPRVRCFSIVLLVVPKPHWGQKITQVKSKILTEIFFLGPVSHFETNTHSENSRHLERANNSVEYGGGG